MRKTEERSLEKLRKNLNTETKCKNYKRNKSSIHGITLIALVITIIVLLILAGVGIATLAGDNGILAKAQKAKDRTVEENLKEELNLSSFEELLNKYDENSDFVSELEDLNVVGMNKFTWYKDTDVTVADVIVLKDGIYYNIIDNGGNFEKVEKIDKLREGAVVLYKLMCDDTADMEFIGEDSLIYNENKYWIFETETSEFMEIYVESEQEILDRKALKIKVNTGDDGSVVLPISRYTDCTIDWGDGTITANKKDKENVKVASLNDTIKLAIQPVEGTAHEYAEKGVDKTVTIIGVVDRLYSDYYNVTRDKIIEIEQWGETGLQEVYLGYCENLRKIASPTEKSFENITEFNSAFSRCTSLTEIPEDLFANCPNVTSFRETFYECTSLTGAPIELWTRGDNSEENSYMGTPDGGGCYYNCTRLNGYESMPSYWKQEIIYD